jgi:ribosomal protein S12 methylthiotransferase
MEVHMISLGCAKNLVDSEKILGALGVNDINISALPEESDAIIINTCGFIQPALAETEEEIERAVSLLPEHARLYVYGCAVDRCGAELKVRHPRVNGWFRLEERDRLLAALHIDESRQSVRLPTTHGYAYLKIAEGCSNRCTYCTIPSIRGPYASIGQDALVHEARQLARLGYKEIVLIAQDTTRYGRDLQNRAMLPGLIRELARIRSIRWIRLMYAHPQNLTQSIIKEIEYNDKVCNYIDLPLQHISTRILRQMNRHYTKSQLMRKIDRLKNIKDISMRTTIIAGFPGETDKEFKELFNFLERGIFDWLGIFPYYKEAGTQAAEYTQVPDDVILARYQELLGLQQELMLRNNKKRIDHVYDVLVDHIANRAFGHAEFTAPEVDAEIMLTGNHIQQGHFYRTRITGCTAHTLFGTPVALHAA